MPYQKGNIVELTGTKQRCSSAFVKPRIAPDHRLTLRQSRPSPVAITSWLVMCLQSVEDLDGLSPWYTLINDEVHLGSEILD
jgi:hypothetical protein